MNDDAYSYKLMGVELAEVCSVQCTWLALGSCEAFSELMGLIHR